MDQPTCGTCCKRGRVLLGIEIQSVRKKQKKENFWRLSMDLWSAVCTDVLFGHPVNCLCLGRSVSSLCIVGKSVLHPINIGRLIEHHIKAHNTKRPSLRFQPHMCSNQLLSRYAFFPCRSTLHLFNR